MALITHQDGPPYAGDDPTLDRPRPNRRRQGGHASHARGGEYRESRRTRYLLLGATCMIPGLILYFGGGYLFVSAYNSRYPFVEISVDAALIRIFWYIGPVFFFIGLVVFVIAYASLCKGIDPDHDYYY